MSAPAQKIDWAKALADLPTKRSCDGCDLCCTAVGVGEIDKAPGVRCPLLKADGCGCSIYGAHPEACQSFACLWRVADDILPLALFPAKCGFVVAIGDAAQRPLVITVHPDPARPLSWDTFYYRSIFHQIARAKNCIVAVGQGHLASTLFAPSGRVYTKAEHPELFYDGGERVGLPTYDFIRDPRFP